MSSAVSALSVVSQAREALCAVGASLFARGYVHATAGNISVRLPLDAGGGYLITPTDACLGRLDPARLAHVDAQGQQVSGDRASKTLVLHRRIYDAACAFDPATACVIHTHSTHLVALSLHTTRWSTGRGAWPELLPPLTPYFVMKVGRVPVMPYDRPGAPAVAEAVAQAITHYGQQGVPLRAVMLPRLGPNVWHQDPWAALVTLEELEETARLALCCPEAPALSEAEIAPLREVFGAVW